MQKNCTCNEVKDANPIPLNGGGIEPHSDGNNKGSVGGVHEKDISTPPAIDLCIGIQDRQTPPPKPGLSALSKLMLVTDDCWQ